MKLNVGTYLNNGRYRIEKVLGQGSFGITYLASAKFCTDGGLGKVDVVAKVAIKEFFMSDVNLRKDDGCSVDGSAGNVFTSYRRKFRKEAENLAKLSHSNIVRVFDVFDENGTSYYVMEYLDGENLDEYIKSRGRLEEGEAIKIIKEVGAALSYMHSKKMLHLDMKPKNIMHRRDSGNILIDFGLSKQYTDYGEPESSTSIGLGTPGYAPLEQAQYTQDGTFPATLDVYALGATMFKMLTGKRPPEATVILNEGFPSHELSNLGISKETIIAITKSMSPFKNDRYHSISDFVSNLKQLDYDEEDSLIDESESIIIDPSRNDSLSASDINMRDGIKSILKKRNKLTTTCLIIGILWYGICCIGSQIPAHTMLRAFFTFSSSICYLLCTIRLFLNIGTGKYLPFTLSFSIFLIGIYRGDDYSVCLAFSVIPYIIILSSFWLKNNKITGFKLLKSTPLSFSIIKQVWHNRNVFVNTLTTIGALVTTYLGFIGMYIIYDGVRNHQGFIYYHYGLRKHQDIQYDDWAFSFMYVSWMIGQILISLGYKLGCWILWFGSLMFVIGQLFYSSSSVSIVLIPVIAEQLILLIRKDNKSAISVMA